MANTADTDFGSSAAADSVHLTGPDAERESQPHPRLFLSYCCPWPAMRELHCLAQVAPAVRHSTGGNPQFRCDFAIGHSTQQGVLFGFPLVQFGEDRPVTEWRLKMPLNLDPSGERLMLVRGGEEQEVFAREEMMAATREILCDKGIR